MEYNNNYSEIYKKMTEAIDKLKDPNSFPEYYQHETIEAMEQAINMLEIGRKMAWYVNAVATYKPETNRQSSYADAFIICRQIADRGLSKTTPREEFKFNR